MKRAKQALVSMLLAASVLGASTQLASAHTGDAWSNSNAFTSKCIGFTNTYPSQLYYLNRSQMSQLGYSMTGALGAGFSRSAFLNEVFYDYAVYVHSHGDNYVTSSGVESAFMQDPGSPACNSYARDAVRSSQVKAATYGTPYNLVIMSTCYLGSSRATMPDAFQIEKTKTSTQREFYLGYSYSTYDSAQLRFESLFWSYLNGAPSHTRTLYQAFVYALGVGGYESVNASNPFSPNWWGNPKYNGTPG
jgi:hypothetical protein